MAALLQTADSFILINPQNHFVWAYWTSTSKEEANHGLVPGTWTAEGDI